MSHAILMYQPTAQLSSRTYSDYETLGEAMQGLCQMFQTRLKQENPAMQEITYDIKDLFKFLESFDDLSLMHFNSGRKSYEPMGLVQIEQALYKHLTQQEN